MGRAWVSHGLTVLVHCLPMGCPYGQPMGYAWVCSAGAWSPIPPVVVIYMADHERMGLQCWPMGHPHAAHGSPSDINMAEPWVTHGSPMGLLWVSGAGTWVSHAYPMGLPWASGAGPCVCHGFLVLAYGSPMQV